MCFDPRNSTRLDPPAIEIPDAAPVGCEEVEGEQAHRAVEGAGGGVVDHALDQLCAIGVRAKRLRGQAQHRARGIDASEGPAGIGFGQRLQLESAARAEHEDMRIFGHALGEQQAGHAVQPVETGDEAPRPFGVARDRGRILEAVEEMLRAFSHDYAPVQGGIAPPCARGNRR